MRAGSRLMLAPGDTRPINVPAEHVQGMLDEGAVLWDPKKMTVPRANNIAQRSVDALPSIGGTVGGFLGITPHMRAANAARLGVAGRGISHVINSVTGVEPQWDPATASAELGKTAAEQSALAYTGEGIAKVGAKVGPKVGEMLMKSTIGRAAVGSDKKALAAGLRPTEKYLTQVTERIAAAKQRALQLGQRLSQNPQNMRTFDELASPIRKQLARYSKYDVTGDQTQNALQEILAEMESKIGPKQVPIQNTGSGITMGRSLPVSSASPTRKGVEWTATGAGTVINSHTTIPAGPISPAELQEINQIAGQKLKDLFAAKQGKLGAAPDPRELGYMKVWSKSKKMLESMGAEGREISKLNGEMQNLYRMHTLASRAGEKALPMTSPIESGAALLAGVGAGAAAHNPLVGAAVGIPGMFLRHALTSPEALANAAHFANRVGPSQGFARAARVAPRSLYEVGNQLLLPVEDK